MIHVVFNLENVQSCIVRTHYDTVSNIKFLSTLSICERSFFVHTFLCKYEILTVLLQHKYITS